MKWGLRKDHVGLLRKWGFTIDIDWKRRDASFLDPEVRMFRRLGWLVGLNYRSWSGKRLTDANVHPTKIKPVAMFDTVQEIAIYIHRFHNLDLFQQGCVCRLSSKTLLPTILVIFLEVCLTWFSVCADGINLRLPCDGRIMSILLWELQQE